MSKNLNSQIFIGLSTNLGNKIQNLTNAQNLISQNNIMILKKSKIYQTEAWGHEDQDEFYNQCIEVSTTNSPQELLLKLQKIEIEMGRTKDFKYGPRIIDLDILYFGQEIIETKNLIVPHPHNSNRNFILIPLAEIAPEFNDPTYNSSITNLLKKCQDQKLVIAIK